MKHLFYSSVCFWLLMAIVSQVTPVFAATKKDSLPPPTSRTQRNIQGWNVQVDDRLLAPPNEALGARVLSLLEAKLVDITYVVPSEPLAKLRATTIVLDLSHGTLHNMQYHPGADWLVEHGYAASLVKCVHIDFYAVDMTKKVTTHVPVIVKGESPAVKAQGGVLVTVHSQLEVTCLPKDLPQNFIVDISKLENFRDSILVSMLQVPTGVVIKTSPDTVIVTVQEPRKEEVIAPVPGAAVPGAEGAVEGAAAAPGAEGAAVPAAGAPAAKPGEKAPAAGKEKGKK